MYERIIVCNELEMNEQKMVLVYVIPLRYPVIFLE
jgi:hypothetical protein